MFAALRNAIINMFKAVDELAQSVGNVAHAANVASSVTVIQAETWKAEALKELQSIQ